MKYICSYSGIPLEVSHFSSVLSITDSTNLELIHPIFHLPHSRLIGGLFRYEQDKDIDARYIKSKCLDTDSTKLLFLALLNSTTLIEWRCPAQVSLATCNKYMHRLASLSISLLTVPNIHKYFPRFVIDSDTCTLPRIKEWLSTWEEAKEELSTGQRNYYRNQDIAAKERALAAILSNASRDTTKYASRLASWVRDAAAFPTYDVTVLGVSGKPETISCADYWVQLIKAAGNPKTNVFSLDKGDILDILDHLEDNLELGTVYSNAIWKLLENTIDRIDNFLGIDFENPYTITSSNTTINAINKEEIAVITNIIADVDINLGAPVRANYPTAVSYLQAMAKYRLAITQSSAQSAQSQESK
jgi:hypothetical protein